MFRDTIEHFLSHGKFADRAIYFQGYHSFGRKNPGVFKKLSSSIVEFSGAFDRSSPPNIKHIWSAIVTKQLPNIIECNQCQWTGLIYRTCCRK